MYDIINMSKFVWNGIDANVYCQMCPLLQNLPSVFKRNVINIKLDGTDDQLITSKLKALIWDDLLDFRQKLWHP